MTAKTHKIFPTKHQVMKRCLAKAIVGVLCWGSDLRFRAFYPYHINSLIKPLIMINVSSFESPTKTKQTHNVSLGNWELSRKSGYSK